MNLIEFRKKVEKVKVSKKEFMNLAKICKENGWGLTSKQCEELIKAHKKAFEENSPKQAKLIETQLTEINFHTLVLLLMEGKYSSALDWCENRGMNEVELQLYKKSLKSMENRKK